jgi:hypothetical protein
MTASVFLENLVNIPSHLALEGQPWCMSFWRMSFLELFLKNLDKFKSKASKFSANIP